MALTCPFEHRPRLVGTVSSVACLESLLGDGARGADLIELRFDSLPAQIELAPLAAAAPGLLGTWRSETQGGGPGAAGLSAEARARALAKALPHLAALDFEWDELDNAGIDLFGLATEAGVTRIASEHDFEGTPSRDRLNALIAEVAESPRRPDILKIACRLRRPSDVARLFELLDDPPLPLALMGMGPLGPASRLALTAAGSALIYGYLETPAAPGQQSVAELRQQEKLWHPTIS